MIDRIFRKIGGPGALSGDVFTTGAATTADHHILFDATTGVISYDRYGSHRRDHQAPPLCNKLGRSANFLGDRRMLPRPA